MSIQSEITRISNNVQNTIDVIEQTGVSVPAGANSDALPSLAQSLANEKQDKLTGTQGQIVGFDADGNAVAQEAPSGLPEGGTTGQVLTKTENGAEWADAPLPKSIQITLSASGWSNNAQTVTATGVLTDESAQLIQPMPAIASQIAYMSAGIYCSGQAANSLTFTCSETPTEDIALYIVITEVGA